MPNLYCVNCSSDKMIYSIERSVLRKLIIEIRFCWGVGNSHYILDVFPILVYWNNEWCWFSLFIRKAVHKNVNVICTPYNKLLKHMIYGLVYSSYLKIAHCTQYEWSHINSPTQVYKLSNITSYVYNRSIFLICILWTILV